MSRHNYVFDTTPLPYHVRQIGFIQARDFVKQHHYSKSHMANCTAAFGLFEKSHLLGVLSFGTPISENVRASVFGPERKHAVTSLHRLVILDCTPRNTESFFIARCLDELPYATNGSNQTLDYLESVVSFADGAVGHVGTIYRATNARFYGLSDRTPTYLDADGCERAARQCGVNIGPKKAEELGWTVARISGKYRYCFLLPRDKRHRKKMESDIRLPKFDYPKNDLSMNGLASAA